MKMISKMNYRNKTKDELIKELQKLQQDYDSLKTSYSKDISGFKQTEKLLKESTERLNEAQKLAHIGVWDWKPDTDTVTWTDELYRIAGLDPMLPAPTYKEHSNLYTPESWELLKTGVEKAMETGESYQFELELIRPNGDTCYVNAFGGAKYDSKGQVNGLFGTVQDITERKQAEEKLQKSELKYRNLIEQAPYIIFVVDAEGNLLFVNQAGQKMLGYSEDELLKMKSVDTYPAGEMTIGNRRLKEMRALRAGEIMHFERLMRRKDGKLFPVEISIGALEDGNTHAIIRDITERKKAEKSLILEKENFRHSLDDSPLGVRIVTKEGNTIYCNQTILNYYGYESLEELQKTLLKDRYTPDSFAEAQKRKRQRKRGDFSATDYEISIVRKNGEIRHLKVFRKKVLWDDLWQFQIIYDDITERKKADEEIRKSKKLLEDLHKHLNEILENERASISREIHDQIGQSLTALKLDLNWMHKYIIINPESVAKLEGMIELISNTIKDVQRISSDLRPGILDDLGLAAAVEWYCDEFEERTGIRCTLKLKDSTYDDSRKNIIFFRILQEALTNVIRHANASSVNIILHQSKKGTTMTIQDNGIGMLPGKAESDKSLGLVGMRERVKQFNGKIVFSLKKGEGTKLIIFIPSK
jgi:PAS domain S-box-containing protein